MKKWEYSVLPKAITQGVNGEASLLNMFLNEVGKNGWELVQYETMGSIVNYSKDGKGCPISITTSYKFIFKRSYE